MALMHKLPILLFHFFNLFLGITAIFILLRRVSLVSYKLQNAFLKMVMFYNFSIIFAAILDFMFYIYYEEYKGSIILTGIHHLISIFFLVSIICWVFYYIKLIYIFLGTRFEPETHPLFKKGIIGAGIIFLLLYTERMCNIIPGLYISLYNFITVTSLLTVLGFSIYLVIKVLRIANSEHKKALLIFGLLISFQSFFYMLVFQSDFALPVLSSFSGPAYIAAFLIANFLFNAFIIFWTLKFMDYLNTEEEPITVSTTSMEKLFEKYQISKREEEIIVLICAGKSNQEIADKLFISVGTVKSHLHNIYTKLGIKNRTHLAKLF